MTKAKTIVEKIDQIVKISNYAYVYTDESASVVKYLNKIRKRIQNFQDDQISGQTYYQVLTQLNNIYKTTDGLSKDEWTKKCLIMPITQPFTDFTEATNFLNEAISELGIKIKKVYQVRLESVTNKLKTVYGILDDPSKQENEKVKNKLKEIEKYFDDIDQPLFDSKSPHKSKKRRNSDEEFNDFSNVQKYKIKRSDYSQEDKVIFACKNYTVYKGKMNSSNEKVSIIVFDEENYPLEKLKRLINVLITAQHPNLETFIGAVSSSKPYVIVTRRIGNKLSSILKEPRKSGKKDTNSIWKNGNRTFIAFKVAFAMAYLHSINIIHRDLCTSNIYVDKNFNPRITNFVNSRFLPDDLNLLSLNPFSSACFKAPELISDEKYDETVDVFSFSGILYELLTGKKPFEKLPTYSIDDEIRSKHRPNLPSYISTDLKELIENCWSQDKELRPSFSEIISTMITKQISFPGDEEYVKLFYQSKTVKNDDLKYCLEMLKNIKMAMNYVVEFTRVIFRIRTFLHSYQFALENSEYATKDEIEDSNKFITLLNMKVSLENLFVAIMYATDNRWPSFAPNNPSTFIPISIYMSMEEIYVSMNELGFKVPKYEFINNDLLLDLRRVYIYFKAYEKDVQQSKERMKEIEDFLNERGLEIKVTHEELNEHIQNTLMPFKDFYKSRDDFEIIEEISYGKSSIVYKAQQISTGKLVAIKELKDDYLASDDNIMNYLRREISSLIALHHKYLVDFVGFNNDEQEMPWIITEIVNNGDLYIANMESSLDDFQKTKIAFEIAEGMEYLHLKRVIHRDLKTLNILLNDDTPKITDFGLSRIDISLTMTNQIGTRNYMSPEIILGGNYSFATDVFSYALLLWELYAIKIPYSWIDNIENAIVSNEPLPYKNKISQELADLIEDAKKFDPKSRPSFTEIIQRMITNRIHFPNADIKKVEDFYKMKEKERESLKK